MLQISCELLKPLKRKTTDFKDLIQQVTSYLIHY